MNSTSILKRLDALRATLKPLPTFSELSEQWKNMDELSKSLYQTALSCPELVGADGKYWEVVSGYLQRMGYTAEPFSIDLILASLESDR